MAQYMQCKPTILSSQNQVFWAYVLLLVKASMEQTWIMSFDLKSTKQDSVYGITENNVYNHISFASIVGKHFFFETGNILGDSGTFLF